MHYFVAFNYTVIFFPQYPISDCTQKRFFPRNKQLFEMLVSTHCSVCGPRPYLPHIIQTWL